MYVDVIPFLALLSSNIRYTDGITLTVSSCVRGMHLIVHTRLMYWRDASHNTVDYCIGGMHLTKSTAKECLRIPYYWRQY